ncbi:Olfactory receptor-like protein OLF3 [Liparis tanakae]|uniref:Olfactory receptor-like protein OLF3 n=1 Tax=Liparis tanakae TaxID=230148 RepID=A0A4Z2EBL1_9TELE|nr:Olfactory receptor-like protein OLF3 [Liparis tanakae]
MNASESSASISFTVYGSLRRYNAPLLVVISVLYVSCVCVNLFLVLVVWLDAGLHRPMYVLLVNLCLSGVAGSSSVVPQVMRRLLADRPHASVAGCLAQVFFINVYSGCIFCILALMAYDRYVSICKPLLYRSIMTPARVRLLLLLLYLGLGSVSAVQVVLTSRLRLCRHAVDRLSCDGMAVAGLACVSSPAVAAFGLCCAVCVVLCPCVLVMGSYLHILLLLRRSSGASQIKGLQTCTPHLVTFVNFSAASFFGVIYNRLSPHIPDAALVFMCVNFFLVPPLLHPIIYGIKMQEIRQSVKKMMSRLM